MLLGTTEVICESMLVRDVVRGAAAVVALPARGLRLFRAEVAERSLERALVAGMAVVAARAPERALVA